MFDASESLLPKRPDHRRTRAVVVVFDDPEEIHNLLRTLEVNVAETVTVTLRRIVPATYIGEGKVEDVKSALDRTEADLLVMDIDLSPQQLRNLEKAVGGKPVLDRAGVILEIFSQHARTKEAKTQVEIARLEYIMPRLAHFWTHFERQRGGGTGMRGMGEKQLEVDRRLLKKRVQILRGRLKDIEKERRVQRAARKNVLKVALVGYTNAGKSTLLNALTRSDVLAEDKLFATLDASVRLLDPNSHPPVVAIDTVGFISKIPTTLIASFRSTLEELREADLLVHVVDASSPHAREQMKTTEEVLRELELGDKPRMVVINKIDLSPAGMGLNLTRTLAPGAQRVSALNPDDMHRLRDVIMENFRQKLEEWEIVLPYSESKREAQIHAYGVVDSVRYLDRGIFYKLRIHPGWAARLGLKKFQLKN